MFLYCKIPITIGNIKLTTLFGVSIFERFGLASLKFLIFEPKIRVFNLLFNYF
ncbi:hypothetical protein HYE34_01295 [Mycoplasmopsis bovis]|nr:hypothetical protein HYE34_01295 [Mycoplasmopsis bovis]